MRETEHLVLYRIGSLLIVAFLTTSLNAQIFPDPEIDMLLKSGITNIINQRFEEAVVDFKKLEKDCPDLPLGKIYLAACKIAEAYDLAEEYDMEFIEENLEEAKIIAEELIEADENKIWHYYYLALAEGYSSYYEAINNNWFSAISSGMNSINAYGICLNIDSTFYEAYIGIGTYEYWMSRSTEFLDGLPFYKDERTIGIEKLKEAIENSSYNSYLAINSLVWIYIEEQNYVGAIEIGQKAVNDFPSSRYFKWGLARAYEDVDPRTSVNIYTELLNSYLTDHSTNLINEVVLKHLIAQQYFKIGENEKSLELCEEILAIQHFSEFEISQLENRLERVNQLKNAILEKN